MAREVISSQKQYTGLCSLGFRYYPNSQWSRKRVQVEKEGERVWKTLTEGATAPGRPTLGGRWPMHRL